MPRSHAARRADGRGRQVLGRPAARHAVRRFRARHADRRQLRRLRGGSVEGTPQDLRRSRDAAGDQWRARAASTCSGLPTSAPWVSARRSITGACRSVRSSRTTSRGTAGRWTSSCASTLYDRYVTPRTRFWNASGLDVSLGTNGIDVRTESLVALLAGSVAFDTPAADNDRRLRRGRPALCRLRPTPCSLCTPTARRR